MAYEFEIDPTKPPANGSAGQGDDVLREIQAGFLERWATIIEDVNANPWVIKTQALESKFGPAWVRHLDFQPRDQTSPISRGVGGISPNAHTNLVVYGGAVIPIGALITGAHVRYTSMHLNAVIGITLYRVYDGGGPDSIATFAPTSGAGFPVITSGSVTATTVREGDTYVFVISLDTNTSPNINDVILHWAAIYY